MLAIFAKVKPGEYNIWINQQKEFNKQRIGLKTGE
jgi:hypothetical protein